MYGLILAPFSGAGRWPRPDRRMEVGSSQFPASGIVAPGCRVLELGGRPISVKGDPTPGHAAPLLDPNRRFLVTRRPACAAGARTRSLGLSNGTGVSPGPKQDRTATNAGGNTDEMYATSTSGMGPTGPARTSTGRSFIPAVSPNGKLARQISPGCIYGLAVRQRVNVLRTSPSSSLQACLGEPARRVSSLRFARVQCAHRIAGRLDAVAQSAALELEIVSEIATQLTEPGAGLYFDWGRTLHAT